eukprot:gnl/TRDRNA2_/TRDRNA2_82066_c0_seq1.p1 gnl/TRDRNA2_/TRDRNA2_82066_c0~~gnl/TRDRNA2_/TRDRNA2_82066_c0_seq1.p1  ORF type:complete len:469 (-),score=60.54 gnl/TRDRNA2_/TRDRNA2_82066_c0_seq1:488-1861(-)
MDDQQWTIVTNATSSLCSRGDVPDCPCRPNLDAQSSDLFTVCDPDEQVPICLADQIPEPDWLWKLVAQHCGGNLLLTTEMSRRVRVLAPTTRFRKNDISKMQDIVKIFKEEMFADKRLECAFESMETPCPAQHQYQAWKRTQLPKKACAQAKKSFGSFPKTVAFKFPKKLDNADAIETWNKMPILLQVVKLTNENLIDTILGPYDDEAERQLKCRFRAWGSSEFSPSPEQINYKFLQAGANCRVQVAHVYQWTSDGYKRIWDPSKAFPHFNHGDKLAGGTREEFSDKEELLRQLEDRKAQNMFTPRFLEFANLMTQEGSEPELSLQWLWCIQVPVPDFMDWTVVGDRVHSHVDFKVENGKLYHPGYAKIRQMFGLTLLAIIPETDSGRPIILYPKDTDLVYQGDVMLFPFVFNDDDKHERTIETENFAKLIETVESKKLFISKGGMPWSERHGFRVV